MAVDLATLDDDALAAEVQAATTSKEAAQMRLHVARYDLGEAAQRHRDALSEQARRMLQVPDPLPVALALATGADWAPARDVANEFLRADAAADIPDRCLLWLFTRDSAAGPYPMLALDLDACPDPAATAAAVARLVGRWSACRAYPDTVEFLLRSSGEPREPESFASVQWERGTGTAIVTVPGGEPAVAETLADAFRQAAASAQDGAAAQ